MSKSPLRVEMAKSRSWEDRFSLWIPIVIALCALVMIVDQGYTNRKHNRLSVHPAVNCLRYISVSPPAVRYTLSSTGLGPLVVTSYRVFIDGNEFEYDSDSLPQPWFRLWNQLEIPISGNHFWITLSHIDEGMSLSPGQEIIILEIPPESATIDKVHLFNEKVLKRLSIVVEYESVYGDQAARATLGLPIQNIRTAD